MCPEGYEAGGEHDPPAGKYPPGRPTLGNVGDGAPQDGSLKPFPIGSVGYHKEREVTIEVTVSRKADYNSSSERDLTWRVERMAGKGSVPAKKTAAAKTTRSKVSKGDSVVCEVCGLSVVVEEVGGIAVSEETTLVCCGKPMKARKAAPRKAKAANPITAKTVSGWPLAQAAGSSGPAEDPKEDVKQQ